MKKEFRKIILSATIVAGFSIAINGCGKVKETIPVTENSLFSNSGTTGAYFVLEDPKTEFKVPVGLTAIATRDRTINFSVSSPTGATEGQQYSIGASSITIPAGSASAELSLKGIFDGYPTGRRDTLLFKLTGGDIPSMASSNTYAVVMQKFCPVLLEELEGVYNDTRETTSNGGSPYGPYSSTVELTPIAGSTTKANIKFTNFWDSNFDVVGTIDWSNPAAFTVNIPRAYTGLDYAPGQPIDVRASPNQSNTFSSCDQSFSLTVDFIVNNYPGPGSAAFYSQNYKIYIKR